MKRILQAAIIVLVLAGVAAGAYFFWQYRQVPTLPVQTSGQDLYAPEARQSQLKGLEGLSTTTPEQLKAEQDAQRKALETLHPSAAQPAAGATSYTPPPPPADQTQEQQTQLNALESLHAQTP